jgi:hypothetical protein
MKAGYLPSHAKVVLLIYSRRITILRIQSQHEEGYQGILLHDLLLSIAYIILIHKLSYHITIMTYQSIMYQSYGDRPSILQQAGCRTWPPTVRPPYPCCRSKTNNQVWKEADRHCPPTHRPCNHVTPQHVCCQ